MEFKHFSVLFSETMEHLNIREGGLYADGTLGGGGHSEGILLRSNTSRLIGIDRDRDALRAAGERLSVFGDRVSLVHANYSEIKRIVGDKLLDGAVLDLGVSSYQLDNKDRGFSYMHDAPLDMRMDQGATLSAYEVVNTYSEEELTRIFYEYGEEKWSKRIAKFIVDARPVKTTGELSDIIKAAIPKAAREQGGHPAKRIFQAIRIEVNSELSLLKQSLLDFVDVLAPGGRLAVITFHSLEDRITKLAFSELAKGCICPKEFPVCMCNHKPTVKIITKKPILPSLAELRENSRSKSAKLRVVEKI